MSKETKFTKGEWFIAGRYIESETGRSIHQISGGYVAQTKTETANAHLIKTSPKLYAVLDEFIALVEDDSSEDFLCKYQEIKELLAEARGE